MSEEELRIAGVAPDEWPHVAVQADEVEAAHSAGGPIHRRALADYLEAGLDWGAIAPDDPPFWRAVAAELRRRAD